MAKGNVGMVNVGSLINPTEALSRSLTDLSKMYGSQAENEARAKQLAADKAESNRRFALDQNRLSANTAESKRRFELGQTSENEKLAANQATNTWLANTQQGNVKFKEGDYSAQQQKVFGSAKSRIENARNATSTYFSGDNSDEALEAAVKPLRSLLNVEKIGESAVEDRINQRKSRLVALRSELDGITDPAARQEKLSMALSGLYDPAMRAIDDEIALGSSLVKQQKNSAIMRSAPAESLKYGNYAQISKSVLDGLTGETEKSLLDAERIRTTTLNDSEKSDYNNAVNKISSYNNKVASGNKRKNTGMGKLIDILKFEDGNDFGILDNPKVKAGVEMMLTSGVDEETIALAIQLGSDTQLFGIDKIFPEPGTDKFIKLHAFAQSLSDSKRSNGGTLQNMPARAVPKVARTVSEIQRDMLSGKLNVPIGVLQVSRQYLERKAEELTNMPEPSAVKAAEVVPAENLDYLPPAWARSDGGVLQQLPKKEPARNIREAESLKYRFGISAPAKFTDRENFMASNIKAGLEKGIPVESFTEDEQKLLPKIRGIKRSIRIGREVLNLQKAGTLENNKSTLPKEVIKKESDLRLIGSRAARYSINKSKNYLEDYTSNK
jgi:hypothetical protein